MAGMLSEGHALVAAVDRHSSREGGAGLDELLTVADAAHFLNVTVSWVYEHARDDAPDRLPALRLGKYLRFDRRDLHAYIDAKREGARTIRRRR